MISINNKPWDKLSFADVKKLLAGADDETFFFEFKKDDVKPEKIIEEISAFANTYGGYVLLGIDDDKSISGCQKWTEERIHTTIHDCITPTPTFDVKRMKSKDKTILIIKVEEGSIPPYITNKGKIYERLSSGSYVVKTSDKLSQMYHKHEEQLKRVEKKLSITKLIDGHNTPENVFGCVDIGFSVTTSEITQFQENFHNIDFTGVAAFIKETLSSFSISKVGRSYLISFGDSKVEKAGVPAPAKAEMHNFMEIMLDGSVKCRVLLIADKGTSNVNINVTACFLALYKKIYAMIMGDRFADIFISALKYEELTVLNQFTPYYDLYEEDDEEEIYKDYLSRHIEKYGNNLIIESNRIPKNGFAMLDRQRFDEAGVEFNTDNLLRELFVAEHYNLGYIDSPVPDEE